MACVCGPVLLRSLAVRCEDSFQLAKAQRIRALVGQVMAARIQVGVGRGGPSGGGDTLQLGHSMRQHFCAHSSSTLKGLTYG